MSDLNRDAEIYARMTERGRTTWHCSEEYGSPDVGISLGLGGNAMMWIGEMSEQRYGEGGAEVAALGSSSGWWLMIYPEARPIAKFTDAESARSFMDHIEGLCR